MVWKYIEEALTLGLEELVFAVGPVLLIGMAMHFLSEYLSGRLIRSIGYKPYIYLTAVGTVIHELGHAVFCVIFRHRITGMNLFSPRPDGTLGSVSHSYNPGSLYQRMGNFFIGTGPIVFGPAVIYLMGLLLLGGWVMHPVSTTGHVEIHTISGLIHLLHRDVVAGWKVMLRAVSHGYATDIRLWIFAYLVFAIGGHVTLSPQDLRSSREGLVLFVGLVLLFNIVLNLAGSLTHVFFGYMMRGAAYTVAIMLTAMLLNLVISAVIILVAEGIGRLR